MSSEPPVVQPKDAIHIVATLTDLDEEEGNGKGKGGMTACGIVFTAKDEVQLQLVTHEQWISKPPGAEDACLVCHLMAEALEGGPTLTPQHDA